MTQFATLEVVTIIYRITIKKARYPKIRALLFYFNVIYYITWGSIDQLVMELVTPVRTNTKVEAAVNAPVPWDCNLYIISSSTWKIPFSVSTLTPANGGPSSVPAVPPAAKNSKAACSSAWIMLVFAKLMIGVRPPAPLPSWG